MGGEEMSSGGGNMDKILVSIRVRPLNDKELTRNDVCDWDCINNNTIVCKHNFPERSLYPSAYTFDRVFGFDCPTKQVYEKGAKEVALCVLSGINSSIFAYGQTSSGKTYTMSGITEFAIDDIFDYVEKHKEREFSLKFSALEIYNEAVRDLLSGDNTPLRLLDDPERGTVVEKLTEETLRDRSHLEELLSICETQRRIGETSLNETSSRSHQILRLTIESSGVEYSGDNSSTLAASVSFVDLAGSERASQTLAAGTRLKEGSHINRSLLTLGTVIRKLSKGKNGHVPYRDSKLTRILQNSLGGNARTAIICTMSPARSHVEQSRNTLLFASCAKEVSTNAQVNLVVSEKALVKQLQRELARMEKELKGLGSGSASSDFSAMLKQKEELIEKMEKQIKELTWQRDLAQSRVENILKSAAESSRMDDYSVTSSLDIGNPLLLDADIRRRSNASRDFGDPIMLYNSGKSNCLDLSENSEEDDFLLDDSTPKFSGPDLCKGWEEIAQRTSVEPEDVCKEVRCIELEGEEISGQAEKAQTQESLDVVVDKKAVSEVLSPRKEESSSTMPSLEQEENEKSYSKDESCTEKGDEKISSCSESEDVELASKKGDADMILYIKHGGDEQPLKNLDMEPCLTEEIKETEQSLEREEKEMSSFVEQTKQSSWKERKMSLNAQQTDQHLEKEDGKLRSSPKQNKQSPEEGGLELMPAAMPEDDNSSRQNRDREFGQVANKVHDKSFFACGDREAKSAGDIDIATYEFLKEKVKEMQKTIEYLISIQAAEQQQSPSVEADYSSHRHLKLKRSRSCKENLLNVRTSLWFGNSDPKENSPPAVFARGFNGRSRGSSRRLSELKDAASIGKLSSKNSNTSSMSFDAESTVSSTSIDAQSVKESDAENGSSFHEFIAGLKEMASRHMSIDAKHDLDNEFAHDGHNFFTRKNETKKIKLQNLQNNNAENTNATHGQSGGHDDTAEETAAKRKDSREDTKDTDLKNVQKANEPYSGGPSDFEKQQQQIIELWEACNVPLIHRTYFFLLFKGDPSDFVYMEVEFRRLSFLKDSMSHGSKATRKQSVKALAREKEWLAKQIPKMFTRNERKELYQKWGIGLNTKQRSLRVAYNIWTKTQDKEHIKESASLVAKLVGFEEPSQTPKEMFGLSLSPRSLNRKSSGWRLSKSLSGISFIG